MDNSLIGGKMIQSKKGFTLAEVLITLGIIGIVAAMTMPTLVGKYKKQQTLSQLKKVYSTISQAFTSSVADNGDSSQWVDTSLEVNEETTTQYFDKYWKPYLKVLKYCKTAASCGYNKPYVDDLTSKDSILLISDSRTGIFLEDGTLLSFVAIDWSGGAHFVQRQLIRADINGPKPPNVMGKDIFVFVLNLNNNTVKPSCNDKSTQYVNDNCKKGSGDGVCCLQKIVNDNWEIKDDYPF